jgi:hypothetical protein
MVRTSGGARSAHVIDDVRERWRARSLQAGWSVPEDWWAPAVESVAEAAVTASRNMAGALHQLGRARGRAGVGIGETLDDLGALFAVLGWTDPPLPLVRAVAEGWVDSGLAGLGAETCEDPLTGLVTLSYLRSRLAELYRAAGAMGASVAGSHVLVMVDLADGSPPWRRLARAVVAAHDLRAVFDAGETLTLIGTGRAAALVAVRPELEPRIALLRTALADDGPARVWIEPLPAAHDEAMVLLDLLSSS